MHTVYVPADRYTATCRSVGRRGARPGDAHGGWTALCRARAWRRTWPPRSPRGSRRKLDTEPIEDLRLDFEDGYGNRGDDDEDADAVPVAARLAAAVAAGTAPAFVGLRFKCFEAPTRRRGLRTLDLFLSTLLERRRACRTAW